MADKGKFKRDLLAAGQVWAGHMGGERRIVEVKGGRVYFEKLPGGSAGGQRRCPKYGDVSVERFCIWSGRLVKTALESRPHQPKEVVNERGRGNPGPG